MRETCLYVGDISNDNAKQLHAILAHRFPDFAVRLDTETNTVHAKPRKTLADLRLIRFYSDGYIDGLNQVGKALLTPT